MEFMLFVKPSDSKPKHVHVQYTNRGENTKFEFDIPEELVKVKTRELDEKTVTINIKIKPDLFQRILTPEQMLIEEELSTSFL